MSTTVLNFKRVEVVAESKEAALAQVSELFTTQQKDATTAFKNWKNKKGGIISERDIKEFMLDYLNRNTKNCPGACCLITLEAAVKDTRERPYKQVNVKSEGRRKYKKFFNILDEATNELILRVGPDKTKAEAANVVKDLYKTGDLKKDVTLSLSHEVVEGTSVVMKFKYTPSKNSKPGRYVFFGIVND
jgi:hypothetical protein